MGQHNHKALLSSLLSASPSHMDCWTNFGPSNGAAASVGRSVGGSKRSTCRADGTACFAAPRDTRRARKDLWPNRFQQDPFAVRSLGRLVVWSIGVGGVSGKRAGHDATRKMDSIAAREAYLGGGQFQPHYGRYEARRCARINCITRVSTSSRD